MPVCNFEEYWTCLSYDATVKHLNNCSNECKETCRTVTYDTRVNMAAFPDPVAVRLAEAFEFPVTDEEVMRRRMLQLNVYYISLVEKMVTQHPRYNTFDIFSTIGGLMGLCLGVSFISVLELCDFGVNFLFLLLKPSKVNDSK